MFENTNLKDRLINTLAFNQGMLKAISNIYSSDDDLRYAIDEITFSMEQITKEIFLNFEVIKLPTYGSTMRSDEAKLYPSSPMSNCCFTHTAGGGSCE